MTQGLEHDVPDHALGLNAQGLLIQLQLRRRRWEGEGLARHGDLDGDISQKPADGDGDPARLLPVLQELDQGFLRRQQRPGFAPVGDLARLQAAFDKLYYGGYALIVR